MKFAVNGHKRFNLPALKRIFVTPSSVHRMSVPLIIDCISDCIYLIVWGIVRRIVHLENFVCILLFGIRVK